MSIANSKVKCLIYEIEQMTKNLVENHEQKMAVNFLSTLTLFAVFFMPGTTKFGRVFSIFFFELGVVLVAFCLDA